MARVAVRLPPPCWLRLRRGGCGVSMGVEAPMPRELTRRGCPSGARSAKRVPRRTPQPPRRRSAPSHREGVADWGSPFFWVLFFGEAKNKYLARRGESRPPHPTQARRTDWQASERNCPGVGTFRPGGQVRSPSPNSPPTHRKIGSYKNNSVWRLPHKRQTPKSLRKPQAARIIFSSFTASTAKARMPSASFSVAIASSFSA